MSRTFTLKERKSLEIQDQLEQPAQSSLHYRLPERRLRHRSQVGTPTYDVLSNMGGMRADQGTIRFRM